MLRVFKKYWHDVFGRCPTTTLLAVWLSEKGFNTIYTNDLPDGDETPDYVIRGIVEAIGRVVVTKGSAFRDNHLIFGRPAKLLLVMTGNLKNRQLLDLFRQNFSEIVSLFQLYNLVELNNEEIIVHQ